MMISFGFMLLFSVLLSTRLVIFWLNDTILFNHKYTYTNTLVFQTKTYTQVTTYTPIYQIQRPFVTLWSLNLKCKKAYLQRLNLFFWIVIKNFEAKISADPRQFVLHQYWVAHLSKLNRLRFCFKKKKKRKHFSKNPFLKFRLENFFLWKSKG